jgi:hypothetical protein
MTKLDQKRFHVMSRPVIESDYKPRPPGLVRGHPAMDVPTAIGVPKDHSSLRNAPEFDYSSFYETPTFLTGVNTHFYVLRS